MELPLYLSGILENKNLEFFLNRGFLRSGRLELNDGKDRDDTYTINQLQHKNKPHTIFLIHLALSYVFRLTVKLYWFYQAAKYNTFAILRLADMVVILTIFILRQRNFS